MADPEFCNHWIEHYIEEIRRDFMHPELGTVLETVGPNGEFLDHFDGRTLNPGHAIEAAWFIMREARYRGNDPQLLQTGLTILDWMWARGWDVEYGGITYFVDVKGLPVQEYWHDMKFWWPQNEAIIATLMAYRLTGDEKYARWHAMIHDWAYAHFPDPEYGEWFGYLHRDGRLAVSRQGQLLESRIPPAPDGADLLAIDGRDQGGVAAHTVCHESLNRMSQAPAAPGSLLLTGQRAVDRAIAARARSHPACTAPSTSPRGPVYSSLRPAAACSCSGRTTEPRS